ncbi:MAG: efflux RND transporter periplasmic adaptor subunit, partial [Flavobacteriaceae bacterium]|nr:efflux RND transporter periplasmic adaptor subunit [Flavobacteriaceae bacterium]
MNTLIKYIVSIFISLLAVSCGKSDNQAEKINTSANQDRSIVSNEIIVSKAQFESENMKLANLQEVSFPTHIKTTGTIDVPPNSKAIISAQIGGYIKSTPLLIGDRVKKGQALVTIENLDFIQMQQEYLETSEQLTYLKSEYERQEELFAEKIS